MAVNLNLGRFVRIVGGDPNRDSRDPRIETIELTIKESGAVQ